MTRKDHILKYAKRELELSGFDKSPLAAPILNFLEAACDMTDGDEDAISQLVGMLDRLGRSMPIAAITEEDFEEEAHSQDSNTVTIMRCTRYPYVYKMPDGKYYDDRAMAFRYSDSAPEDRMYLYQCGNSSKQEIELPYYPTETVVTMDREQDVSEQTQNSIEPDYEVE